MANLQSLCVCIHIYIYIYIFRNIQGLHKLLQQKRWSQESRSYCSGRDKVKNLVEGDLSFGTSMVDFIRQRIARLIRMAHEPIWSHYASWSTNNKTIIPLPRMYGGAPLLVGFCRWSSVWPPPSVPAPRSRARRHRRWFKLKPLPLPIHLAILQSITIKSWQWHKQGD